METLSFLLDGFMVALTPANLMWVTIGGLLGTIIGMLPGLGPATGVAVLLPLTFSMGPTAALITMGGVYYGAMYGGSRASILINTPGDGAAVAATFDGYPMTQQGRAESALAISAIASFIGGIFATICMVAVAIPVAHFALKFGPAEYFMLFLFALSATASMTEGNRLRGFIATILGLMIATIGIDGQSGVSRFTMGILELQSGIDFLIVIIAVYALGEVFKSFKNIDSGKAMVQKNFGKIWISRVEWKRCVWPILRSAPLGFFVGALPGAGGTMASLMSYNNEKQLSKNPEEFGKGAIEGLAAPESANNAASVGAMIPMLTLGIPGSGTTAVMMGALLLLGLQPGPMLFQQQPLIVWGLIASMFIGNIILAVMNIPLAGLLVRVLSVPPKILYPIVLGLSFVGAYAISYSVMDFYLLVGFGLLGYFMSKSKFPSTPMILAVIVGNNMEQSFRRAYKIADGDIGIFFGSPICLILFALTVISIVYPMIKSLRNRVKTATA
ncbi:MULTISPECIES: tripartite tricarboxylate transporter permease [unclassified Oceanispirochaeta]|uniref:tripartite tricarboxylate transporter permease n=1 Tax=unclassified Oceanispirochaeta TaxID=2635722 RepID=UPI000E08CEF2|nr:MULTISPECIES: tripartite tricarboxylate transporter permease [unclassified Oceanispirochaeta]MBF9015317.1 tripartite tricarboxylate transporter permease [Oceanispirochaeta sp. M2]NPD71775.1 tripartite tricarboxylate transporter permease [Oceanispirochaeta sp. M1]RDG32965.1 tripartite tricarboxylate transporter permease [Oceanispirochaeta sp. M1]